MHVIVGHAFTYNDRWVWGTLSTHLRWSTGTGARERSWSDNKGMDGISLPPTYLVHWGWWSYVSFPLFWFPCLEIYFIFFGGRPWSVHGPLYGGMCRYYIPPSLPLYYLDLEHTRGSSGRSLGRFQINYPRSSTYDMSPHGTSSLETRVVLYPQLDVRWKFSYYYTLWTLFFWDPIRNQLLDYVLMVAQDWDSICATEDALFAPQYTLFGTGWVSMLKEASRSVYLSFSSCTCWTPSSPLFTVQLYTILSIPYLSGTLFIIYHCFGCLWKQATFSCLVLGCYQATTQ